MLQFLANINSIFDTTGLRAVGLGLTKIVLSGELGQGAGEQGKKGK
jgi:hypothetical protein